MSDSKDDDIFEEIEVVRNQGITQRAMFKTLPEESMFKIDKNAPKGEKRKFIRPFNRKKVYNSVFIHMREAGLINIKTGVINWGNVEPGTYDLIFNEYDKKFFKGGFLAQVIEGGNKILFSNDAKSKTLPRIKQDIDPYGYSICKVKVPINALQEASNHAKTNFGLNSVVMDPLMSPDLFSLLIMFEMVIGHLVLILAKMYQKIKDPHIESYLKMIYIYNGPLFSCFMRNVFFQYNFFSSFDTKTSDEEWIAIQAQTQFTDEEYEEAIGNLMKQTEVFIFDKNRCKFKMFLFPFLQTELVRVVRNSNRMGCLDIIKDSKYFGKFFVRDPISSTEKCMQNYISIILNCFSHNTLKIKRYLAENSSFSYLLAFYYLREILGINRTAKSLYDWMKVPRNHPDKLKYVSKKKYFFVGINDEKDENDFFVQTVSLPFNEQNTFLPVQVFDVEGGQFKGTNKTITFLDSLSYIMRYPNGFMAVLCAVLFIREPIKWGKFGWESDNYSMYFLTQQFEENSNEIVTNAKGKIPFKRYDYKTDTLFEKETKSKTKFFSYDSSINGFPCLFFYLVERWEPITP
jgi:hypothetical protein